MTNESWLVLVPEHTGEFDQYIEKKMSVTEYHRYMVERAAYVVRDTRPQPCEIHIIQCLYAQFDRSGTPFPDKYKNVNDARAAIGERGLQSRLAECCFLQIQTP